MVRCAGYLQHDPEHRRERAIPPVWDPELLADHIDPLSERHQAVRQIIEGDRPDLHQRVSEERREVRAASLPCDRLPLHSTSGSR